jgi:ribosomal protein S7
VRPALAQLAADNLTELQQSVLDAAVSAVRPVWLTVTCGDCGATSRVEAPVPDTRARLQAVELLLRAPNRKKGPLG